MDWWEALPEPVRTWDEVKNSDSPEKFWDQMTNMRTRMGQSIRIPGPDAGTDDWKEFNNKLTAKVPGLIPKPDPEKPDQMDAVYTAMGRPANASEYEAPKIDTKGVEVKVPSEELKEAAHKMGLTKQQFQGVVSFLTDRQVTNAQNAQVQMDTEVAALKGEWGAAFDSNYTAVTRFLEDTSAPAELIDLARNRGMNASAAKWFLSQYKAVAGEGAGAVGDRSTGDIMTPGEAQAAISEIMSNQKHAYFVVSDPGHKAALERMVKLQKLLRGAA